MNTYQIRGTIGISNEPAILVRRKATNDFGFSDYQSVAKFPQHMEAVMFSKAEAEALLKIQNREDSELWKIKGITKLKWQDEILCGVRDLALHQN